MIKKRIYPLLFPLLLLIIWELSGRFNFVFSDFLTFVGFEKHRVPDFSFIIPVSDVVMKLVEMIISGEVLPYLWDTTWRTTVGFIISGLLGTSIGFFLGVRRSAEILFYSTIDGIRSIPPIALLPLFILFLGIEDTMKIGFIIFGAVWPIVLNTFYGVKGINTTYLKVAKNLGHSNRFIFKNVIFPLSLPSIFTGLKISLSISLILSIVVEMIAGNSGLGWLINYSNRNFDFDEMYGAIILVALLGWLLNMLLNIIDSRWLDWYYKSKQN